MPTGGGKSVVYQLPAWCCPGISVIFSPLISLIQDQCDAMQAIGIRAVFLSSTQDNQEIQSLISEMRNYSTATPDDDNTIKMLYITPEKFSRSEQLIRLLCGLRDRRLLSRFVMDEAHCLSQWGHDFRPDYLNLKQLRIKFPEVPLMCLTATANKSVVDDVIKILSMRNPHIHTQSFNRNNLRYYIRKKESDKKLIQELSEYIFKRRYF